MAFPRLREMRSERKLRPSLPEKEHAAVKRICRVCLTKLLQVLAGRTQECRINALSQHYAFMSCINNAACYSTLHYLLIRLLLYGGAAPSALFSVLFNRQISFFL